MSPALVRRASLALLLAALLGTALLLLPRAGQARAGRSTVPRTGQTRTGRSTVPRSSQAHAARSGAHRVAPVPAGFVGVDIDGPVTATGGPVDLAAQMRGMVRAGAQGVRVAFNWAAAEPYATLADVPAGQRALFRAVDGVPVDFAATDRIVAAAAQRHLAVLPTILYAPDWDAVPNAAGVAYPARPGPYAAYAAALVGRYGPRGSFWRENPSLPRRPITEWQIWNEPDLAYYWHQPFESGYVALLAAAHAAIMRADRSAKVVLGALTNRAWVSLAALEHHRGFSHLFDVAAVNGFTKLPDNVILYLRYVRRALDRDGNRHTPILATELSWPAAVGHVHGGFDFDVTRAQQARNIATLLPMLGADRRSLDLAGFDLYTWMGDETGHPSNPFDYAGLLALDGDHVSTTPALAAYRTAALRLEGCRSKGAVATDCRH